MTNYVGATNNRSGAIGCTTVSDSFSHTFGSASNRVAVVLVFFGDAAGQSVSTVTVGGNSATLAVAITTDDVTKGHRAEIWYYAIPDGQLTGAQTIAVQLNTNASYEWWQTCVELSDCSGPRAGSEVSENGTFVPSPQTLSVTSVAGDLVIDALAVNTTTAGTESGTQTVIRSTNNSDVQQASYSSGAASVDMTWTGLGSSSYAHVAVSFQTAGASGAVEPSLSVASGNTPETNIIMSWQT